MSHKHHSPFLWIPTLSAAEEIPTAVITFIALLMFLQFGETMAMSAFHSALLFLPFVFKSFFRSMVRSAGNFKYFLHIAEMFIFVLLVLLVVTIHYVPNMVWLLFGLLFLISSLCAWHDMLGRMYYDRMLYPRQQKIFNKTKIFASEATVVLTYGVLIMFVGLLEVVFRMPTEVQTKHLAWAMECYMITGGFLLFFLMNFFTLKHPSITSRFRYETMHHTVKAEMRILDRIRHQPHSAIVILSFFLLLLPQSLMFFTRVFFLLAKAEDGGLDCSIPDVGFAQGTIGVLAFAFGILLGRYFIKKYGAHQMFWWMAVPLTLSPTFYMFMSHNPLVDNMLAICSMCLLAQLCFGFGLNLCIPIVRFISGERYRNTIGYLYIPLVSALMIMPMAVSGLLCQEMGFKLFFILDTCTAPIALLITLIFNIREKIDNNEINK